MQRRTRMSSLDTAWLRMDSSGNLMMIVGVLMLQGPCDLSRLRRILHEQLQPRLQFRSRVVQDASGTWWEENSGFDVAQHVSVVAQKRRLGKAGLQRLAAKLASESLDRRRPLWHVHVVEDYDGGHALVVRLHHCIADGIALVGVMLGLATARAQADPKPATEGCGGQEEGPLEHWLRALGASTGKVFGGIAARAYARSGASGWVLNAAHLALQAARDLVALAALENDSPTSLKGRAGGSKALAWTEALPLADVKAVSKALDCSVNDVLVGCAAGAIRRYLAERGEQGGEVRAMVPVNLRPETIDGRLGNWFGLVPLRLPTGTADPVERVRIVHRRMASLKTSFQPLLAMALLGVAGMMPAEMQDELLDLFRDKVTAVLTNVPGPRHARYLAGARIRQMMFWVPQSGDISVGVSILSYDGGVGFGLVTDRDVCRAPRRIIDHVPSEFESLVHAVLMMPWDDAVDRVAAERSLDATEALATVARRVSRDRQRVAADGPGALSRGSSRIRSTAVPAARANRRSDTARSAPSRDSSHVPAPRRRPRAR
jgi:WS/DGAT/MGAT family acyltransferase